MWKAVSCCSLSGYAHMVSTTAANMAEQVRRDERADQRLVERVIEGALAGVGAMGLREYLAAAARRDVDEADSLSSDPSSPHRQRPSSSSPSVPDPSSPSVPSLVQILERFADAGGIERARKVTRGHEEVIRLGIEHLKNEALETLEALAAGGYASKPLSMDEYRALELTRRACVSVLRLNPFPTRRDSYTDERGPRLSSEREGAHRGGAEARRGWDDFVAPFPVGEDARVCGFDGKTHGQNVGE